VSENDRSHCSGTTQTVKGSSDGRGESSDVCEKVDREDADVTCCGRPFHTCAAATGKALSPMVQSLADAGQATSC